jgi:hypothetical protein
VASISYASSGSWHCYSAAGEPAAAKGITRLVPRHNNRPDRDAGAAFVRSSRFTATNAIARIEHRAA